MKLFFQEIPLFDWKRKKFLLESDKIMHKMLKRMFVNDHYEPWYIDYFRDLGSYKQLWRILNKLMELKIIRKYDDCCPVYFRIRELKQRSLFQNKRSVTHD